MEYSYYYKQRILLSCQRLMARLVQCTYSFTSAYPILNFLCKRRVSRCHYVCKRLPHKHMYIKRHVHLQLKVDSVLIWCTFCSYDKYFPCRLFSAFLSLPLRHSFILYVPDFPVMTGGVIHLTLSLRLRLCLKQRLIRRILSSLP